MDIQKAFTFISEDEKWLNKLGMGVLMTLLSFLVLPAFILSGYSIEIARRVMQGDERPLPEWTDYGKYLVDGLMVAVAGFVYALPAIILMVVGGITGGLLSAIGDGDVGAALGGGAALIFILIAFVYLIAMMFLLPAVTIQFIRHGNIGACLNFREVIAITRSQIGNIIVAVISLIAAGMVINFGAALLNVIPCLGTIAWAIIMLAVTPYLQYVSGHLFGQIAGNVDGAKSDKLDF